MLPLWLFCIYSKLMGLLKLLLFHNLIMFNHKFYDNFKSYINFEQKRHKDDTYQWQVDNNNNYNYSSKVKNNNDNYNSIPIEYPFFFLYMFTQEGGRGFELETFALLGGYQPIELPLGNNSYWVLISCYFYFFKEKKNDVI